MVTADHYGKINILGTEIEGYVLSDGTACLSESAASCLLGFSTNSVLNNRDSNKGGKRNNPLVNQDITVTQIVIVKAECRHKNSYIQVYTASTINAIAREYATAYLQGNLRRDQLHIGKHCAILHTGQPQHYFSICTLASHIV